ncbi:c-type cytochrome [Hyphomicrobium facile]|uniref:c-type cytochrome n=1 Tax=Hyphomicrobium facile TaxID=51670 RepID=UPI0011600B77|nr:cytochrome c [Hyphomicrobium facile]
MRVLSLIFVSLVLLPAADVGAEDADAYRVELGKMTYRTYCALCHGMAPDTGLFADALKKPAPDLTQIAKRNGGMFPEERVKAIIRDGGVSGHGTMRLLSWERYFRQDTPPEHADEVIDNVTYYLQKHQAP